MAANPDVVKGKVQRFLTSNFSDVNIDSDGDWSLRRGSARCFVRVNTRASGESTWIQVWSPFLRQIPPSPELFHWVATEGSQYIFGHVAAIEGSDGLVWLKFEHTLLGDFLDEEELTDTVVAILGTADDLDDELKGKFGGVRFHED